MAFRKKAKSRPTFDTPEALFRDRRNRAVPGLLSHQADVLRRYHESALQRPNVAIELPTGSGKTLVGLLIAEFRRVTLGERVLYLCPTRQLVRQVVEQSERKYDIRTTPFIGKVKEYDPDAKAKYQSGETIAVATYGALFNTNPFFTAPQLIVLDDAHAAENYVAKTWSLLITRRDFEDVFLELLNLIGDSIDPARLQRFLSDDPDPAGWIETVPVAKLAEQISAVSEFLDVATHDNQLFYPWTFLHGHLEACLAYISQQAILIRPYIPPSMTHPPFADANQRVCMSATLGSGGDLERMTGVDKYHRIPIPEGWDKQGIGRRFFMFPGLSLEDEEIPALVMDAIEMAGRALVLVPSDMAAERYVEMLEDDGRFSLFGAENIETSKDEFVETENSVAVLANRYDGIDLPEDECRLLIIEGLPKAGNLQERHLLSRMAAANLLNDRIRTRIVQAVGRCTRSDTDYAAVYVLGDDFHDWLIVREKQALFHPELQGELQFGAHQSKAVTREDVLENLNIFLQHGDSWESADADIREYRNEAVQEAPPGEELLLKAAATEVRFQYAMWNQDYSKALDLSQDVASFLSGDDVKGLRGFWNYLAASAAHLAFDALGDQAFRKKAADLYGRSSSCVPAMTWLRKLAAESGRMPPPEREEDENERLLAANIEQMEAVFEASSFASPKRFDRAAKGVREGLASREKKLFEEAHRRLGEFLGFDSGNSEATGAPDPWWISNGEFCIVFEDKKGSDAGSPVAVRHARQAASHPQWIRDNIRLPKDASIIAVMITPATTIDRAAKTHAGDVKWWRIDDFRKWAKSAIAVLRMIRSIYVGPGNMDWRRSAAELLRAERLDPVAISERASESRLTDLPLAGSE